MTEPDPNADRLVRLETAVAHLQHDFERLNQVTLDLQTELRQWTLRLSRLERQLEQLEAPPESHSPADDRPPHY
jgi:uncharacterized coiled-coil protein SlyX